MTFDEFIFCNLIVNYVFGIIGAGFSAQIEDRRERFVFMIGLLLFGFLFIFVYGLLFLVSAFNVIIKDAWRYIIR